MHGSVMLGKCPSAGVVASMLVASWPGTSIKGPGGQARTCALSARAIELSSIHVRAIELSLVQRLEAVLMVGVLIFRHHGVLVA